MTSTHTHESKPDGLTILISVYHKDNPLWFDEAIDSITNQTKQSDEIVLVKDGPLTQALDTAINRWSEKYPDLFNIVTIDKNNGLGTALRVGMQHCSYEIIARMDADDISTSERFEKQFTFLSDHPDIDLICSWTAQFEQNPNLIMFERKTPIKHKTIARLAKFRNPIEHGTVMFKRSKALDVGGYQDIEGFEDYYLWARMLINGAQMTCIPESLYKFRWGRQLSNRRRGFKHLRNCLRLEKKFLDMGFISLPIFVFNIIMRTCLYLLPGKLNETLRRLLKL